MISAFLKSEYHHREYHRDREQHESLVLVPDLTSPRQNSIRRELLDPRHAANWSVLPRDTRWNLCEVELSGATRIRLLPTAPWTGIAPGAELTISEIVERIRKGQFPRECAREVAAIHVIAYRLRQRPMPFPALLIGVSPSRPLTILDGNRRLLAAALAGHGEAVTVQAFCGLSPRMAECFCYETSKRKHRTDTRLRRLHLHPAFLKGAFTRWSSVATRLTHVW